MTFQFHQHKQDHNEHNVFHRSQQASLDRLRYSLAGEMVFNFAIETWQRNHNKHSLYIHSKP